MKRWILVWALVISSCADKGNVEPPLNAVTYPELPYEVIAKFAKRGSGEREQTRLVGWDEEFYYFDWWQDENAIGRGIARINRLGFDEKNRGALQEVKGLLVTRGGQIRNLEIVQE